MLAGRQVRRPNQYCWTRNQESIRLNQTLCQLWEVGMATRVANTRRTHLLTYILRVRASFSGGGIVRSASWGTCPNLLEKKTDLNLKVHGYFDEFKMEQ